MHAILKPNYLLGPPQYKKKHILTGNNCKSFCAGLLKAIVATMTSLKP